MKTVPLFGVLSTYTVPPCCSTNRRVTAKPSPEEKNGYTPLFIAENEELDDIVNILEKYDAR